MLNFDLKKFNPKVMEERRSNPDKGPPTIIIIGKRGTGKTYLLRDLLYSFRKTPAGMMMTGSEASAEMFSEFFPESFIFDEVDIDRIENIVCNQQRLRKNKTPGDYSSLLLFDDCGYDKSITRQKIIKKIFCNGRHLKILLIMTIQYCKDIPPDLRSNADYVFILKDNVQAAKKKIWTEYAGIIPDFKTFESIMNKCTEDRGALVIDNTTTSNEIEDNIFWYKARFPHKKYKFGSKELWDFHKQNYKPMSEKEQEEYKQEQENSKGKTTSVVVNKIKRKKK